MLALIALSLGVLNAKQTEHVLSVLRVIISPVKAPVQFVTRILAVLEEAWNQKLSSACLAALIKPSVFLVSGGTIGMMRVLVPDVIWMAVMNALQMLPVLFVRLVIASQVTVHVKDVKTILAVLEGA